MGSRRQTSWRQRIREVYSGSGENRRARPAVGENLQVLYRQAISRYPRVEFAVTLGPPDELLAERWALDSRADYDRCVAARCGELGALQYFRETGRTVRDISITQLADNPGSVWRSHDIEVERRFIDVKNRRRVPGRQTEHFVQRLKRHAGKDVEILATNTIWEAKPPLNVIVAGLTDGPKLRELGIRIQHRAERIAPLLDPRSMLSGPVGGNVPPWAFDYDDGHYAARTELARPDGRFSIEVDEAMRDGARLSPHVSAFAVAHDLPSAPALARADKLAFDLHAHFRAIGVSRTSLFAFVLLYLLTDPADRLRVERLRAALYPDALSRKYPLGIHDPEHCIWDLMHALSALLKQNPSVRHAEQFRVRSGSILQARLDGCWRTVIAYCGNCGHWPLVWNVHGVRDCGVERRCEHARLVCRECGECGSAGVRGCRQRPT